MPLQAENCGGIPAYSGDRRGSGRPHGRHRRCAATRWSWLVSSSRPACRRSG